MTRKLSQAQDGASRMLSIRLPPVLHEALEREAARRSQAAGGIPVSTAAVVRAMIERGLGGDKVPAEQVPDQVLAPVPAAPAKRRCSKARCSTSITCSRPKNAPNSGE